MKLPDPTPVSSDIVAAIATRHALDARTIIPLPQVGIINCPHWVASVLVSPCHWPLLCGQCHVLWPPCSATSCTETAEI